MLSLVGRLNARPMVQNTQRQFSMLTNLVRPSTNLLRQEQRPLLQLLQLQPNPLAQDTGIFTAVLGLFQKRFKTRGNTYQPNTLKRKRTFGFLARLRTKGGRNILKRRKAKGRWYLTH